MSFTTPTACSSAPRFSLKKIYNRGNKKVPKAKSGKPPPHQFYHKPQNDSYPKHDERLHRLGLPPSPSSGTLLERIGESTEDKAGSALTDLDYIDGERMSQGMDDCSNSSFPATPRFYTPEPGEVERFLESVIGVPPAALELPGPADTCLGNKPALTLETHNLPVDHLVQVEDPLSSVSYSPTQTAVNNLASANSILDHFHPQSPLLGDTMPPSSTIQECRKHLVPVLLASAQTGSPANHLDSEQCLRLLSDDQCRNFFRQAKEMRSQLSSLVSQKTPVYQGRGKSLKRDRVDEMDTWVRNTRGRFGLTDAVVSEVSRKDSDITLVDFTGGRLPPKAPRAMLQASQTTLIKYPDSPKDKASYNIPRVTSPTVGDRPPGSTPLTEPVHRAIQMFPALVTTSQPVAQIDTSNASAIQPTGDHSGHPTQIVSPIYSISSDPTDFVSHLPTQPGLWFNQLGRRYAEIVDVDIEVNEEMFYMSRERQPSRLRMHLRLCSIPMGAMVGPKNTDTPASLLDAVNGVIERRALQWPKMGRLVVQVNPESQRSKTWLPHTLKSDPLDVTPCMRPGKNTFRFIQLSDLSEFTFVLVASPPPPEEEWRNWDWASLVERSRTRSFSSADDPTNGLSEFAHIPVTVRS